MHLRGDFPVLCGGDVYELVDIMLSIWLCDMLKINYNNECNGILKTSSCIFKSHHCHYRHYSESFSGKISKKPPMFA